MMPGYSKFGIVESLPGLVGACQDSDDGDGRHCPSPLLNGNRSWRGSPGSSGPRQWRLRNRPARPRTCSPWATSRFIGETAALCAFDGQRRALHVIHPTLLPVAVAEIKFGQIAMQVSFADVLIGAVHAALQDREKSLDGVGVDVAANVLIGTVFDMAVRAEIPAEPDKQRGFVGHEMAVGVGMHGQYSAEVFGANVRHMERPHGAVALDQRKHRVHRRRAFAGLGAWLAAYIGPIGFQGLTLATDGRLKQIVVPL